MTPTPSASATRVDLDRACNRILGTHRLVDHGADEDRWNLVIVAEGYGEHERADFAEHASSFADAMLQSDPFFRLQDGINVHRLDVASCESGADHLPEGSDDEDDCIEVDTAFGASHCAGLNRLLVVDTAAVIAALDAHVPAWNAALVLVNSPLRGGSGAPDVAVVSLGDDEDPSERSAWGIALHELGHSAFGLADEYDFHHPPFERRADCRDRDALPTDDFPRYERYTGAEPIEPNVTTATSWREVPWRHLVDRDAELPTVPKDDCFVSHWCQARSPVPFGTVGLFEGAFYHRCGVYRPTFNCRMNMSGVTFCPVCDERIRRTIGPSVRSETTGRPVFLRAHDLGTGFGPDHDHLDVEVVVRLHHEPERAFGFRYRADAEEAARRAMLTTLRTAFTQDREVRLVYHSTGLDNGVLIGVEAT